jgi:hypothetical protein
MELRAEITINTPAQNAWHILGKRFGYIAEWASPITESSLQGEPSIGTVRTCHIAGFGPVKPGIIKEQLLSFEPASMSFTYQAIQGMPGFISKAINHWSVRPLDEAHCVVSTHATLELRGVARLFGLFLKWKMTKNGAGVLEELRYYIEHKRPHPRKASAILKTIRA